MGYAFAAKKPILMVCSRDRKQYPFDIQHRKIIPYVTNAPSDFSNLQAQITKHLKALLEQEESLDQLAETPPIATVRGLSPNEVILLAVLAENAGISDEAVGVWTLKEQSERAGLSPIAARLGFRRLKAKQMVEGTWEEDGNGDHYTAIRVTEIGWAWIDANEEFFVGLRIGNESSIATIETSDELPF